MSADDLETKSENPSGVTDGGIVHRDEAPRRRRLRVIPTLGDVTNTVVLEAWPTPVACVRLDHGRFAFDSSFPGPSLATEIERLFALRRPGDPDGEKLAIFGHADPIGDEAYNKTLAGRRARAVFALLTRKPALWDELHQGSFHGDRWGIESLYACLDRLAFEPGPVSSRSTDAFRAAVRAFKTREGMANDAEIDKATRLALFERYMEALTGGAESQAYADTDFVGDAREPEHRGAVQGCGERNPALILSEEETRALAPEAKRAARIAAQRPNRRVLIFLFRPEDVRSVHLWPCPPPSAGPDGCAEAAWPDKDERLKPTDKRRLVRRHGKTFGCRFYDYLARLSPCEALRTTVHVWIRDENGRRYAEPVGYELRTPTGLLRRGVTDDAGRALEADVPLERHVELAWAIPEAATRPTVEVPLAEPTAPVGDDAGCDETGSNEHNQHAGPLRDLPTVTPARDGTGGDERAGRIVHFARVRLPVDDDERERRNVQWLENLGYAASAPSLERSMARFALDYGLAQNAAAPEQDKLLEEVHATGREAAAPTATDAPTAPSAPTPNEAPPPEEPAASVRPQCNCDDAPTIAWASARSTLVTPIGAYIPAVAERLPGLPADLLFEMPLFDGKFLGQPLSTGRRPVLDPKTGTWARDFAAPPDKEPFGVVGDEVVTGVSPEMKERLDWAQRRLWFYYCQERTSGGQRTSTADFLTKWLAEKGIRGGHSCLRAAPKDRGAKPETSMHADGCAIDIGAGNAPFICVRGKSGRLYGENHDVDLTLPKTTGRPVDPTLPLADRKRLEKENAELEARVRPSFLPDNVYEPAMAGFDRASLLVKAAPADMTVAVGRFPLPRPKAAPCDPSTDHSVYAEEVGKAWDRFNLVNEAWKKYSAPKTIDEFREQVLRGSRFDGSLPIDADLVAFATANTSPPTSYVLEVEEIEPGSPRRKRKRTNVPMSEVRGNEARTRAAFFQMLRDKESVEMVMVHGSLTFGPSAKVPAKTRRSIPCAWPPDTHVFVPNARDVTLGFLGFSRIVTTALVEAGLTWLGATGGGDGEAIANFTGDIMHFDLRTLHGVGSPDLDAWLEGNRARQAWKETLDKLHKSVGANPTSLKPSSQTKGPLRARVRHVLEGARTLEDPTTLGATLASLVQDATRLGDTPLATLTGDARASLDTLISGRTRFRAEFQLGGARVEGLLEKAASALKTGYFSSSPTEASAALAEAEGLHPALSDPSAVVRDWPPAIKAAKTLTKGIAELTKKAAGRGAPSTEKERQPLSGMEKELRGRVDALSKAIGGAP